MDGAWRQLGAGGIGCAAPASIGSGLAGELLGCDHQGSRYRLQCEQAACNQ